MKTLKDYLIEGAREDLIPLMDEWTKCPLSVSAPIALEVAGQHPELSPEEAAERAGYRWLTMKYPPITQQVQESSQAVAKILQAYHLPKWAIIAWGMVVLLLLGAILARSEPKPHFAFTIPQGTLYQIGGGPFVRVQDEGTTIKTWAAGMAVFNFTGGGITCTAAGSTVTCNVPTGGGGASLDAITAALAAATINNGDNAIVWNWSLTTADKIAFKFGENVASTATGTPILLNIQTLAASTAHPFQATARGTANGIRVDAATGLLAAIGTGGIQASDLVAASAVVADGEIVSAYSGVGACAANTWASTLTRNAAPTCTQPGFSNLSGSAARGQLPAQVVYDDEANTYGAFLQNFTSASLRIPNGLTDPGTCTVGDIFMDTDAAVGARYRLCTALNTWISIDNPFGAAIDDAELASNYSGIGSCTNQVVTATVDNAAPTCAGVSSAMISDGVVASADLATANKTDTKSMVLFDPVTGDSGRIQWEPGKAITITRVYCSVKAATSVTVNLNKRVETTPDTAGTDVLSAGLVCDTNAQTSCASGCDVATITSAGVTARQIAALTISAVTGTPDTLRVIAEYTVD
ncbi:MAG TPA: hypothetical protein VIH17_05785 [Candidatus Acidoferrales bacterium]